MSISIKSNVFDYLDTLSPDQLARLYQHAATCLAIFSLSRQIVSRCLCLVDGVSKQDVENWFNDYGKQYVLIEIVFNTARRLPEALTKLTLLGLVPRDAQHVKLHPAFRKGLLSALTGSGEPSFGTPSQTIDKREISEQFLEDYATRQWESVLHYMVGTRTVGGETLGQGVLSILEKSGLMQRVDYVDSDSDDHYSSVKPLRITSKGFQFLLQDVNTQVWAFLLQYLELADSLNQDAVESLQFLFELGSLELGKDYSTDTLSQTQKALLEDLRGFGMIYQRKSSSTRFYPTRLATSLTSGGMLTTKQSEDSGFIVLETNYRLYAYTDSPLQIAVLSLFTSMRARFRNMVVGMITRDSFRVALANGILAEQIIQYLVSHAHPLLKKATPILPPTVVDQLRLWELERNRLRASSAVLYQDFGLEEDYVETVKFARQNRYLLFHLDSEKKLAITEPGHKVVREWLKKRIQERKKD